MVRPAPLKLVEGGVRDAAKWLAGLAESYPEGDLAVVRKAHAWAAARLEGVTLPNGEPALAHALAVAAIVAGLKLDHETLAAALAYPAAAEGEVALEMKQKLGATVADLALGVTRMAELEMLSGRAAAAKTAAERASQMESLRKMLLAMAQDVRVVLIKLADHTQTLRQAVKSRDEAVRTAAARLAFDLFAPLANRLGVWQLKWELEDLSFRILEPDVYKSLARRLDEKRGDREGYIARVVRELSREVAKAGIRAEVMGRPKHIYSIWRKMQRKGLDFEALHDVRAVRVLVDDVKDCYTVLGIVHNLWTPIPGEFDDYIAKPKSNNYRSLHTAVAGPEGKAVEVQIRTHEMHQASELGVAAHWRYKEGSRGDARYDEKIAWLRQFLEWKEEVADAGELAEQLRTELFEDTVYVLSPQGRVVDLPAGATPVDFAYHIHSTLGHRCRGAKVDNVMVPLNTPLRNGQQVEILSAKQGGPSRDWLNPQLGFIKSSSARAKVRQWFNKQNLETAIAHGRAAVEKELQRQGMTSLNLDKLAAQQGYAKLDDFLAEIGRGKIGPRQIQLAIRPEEAAAPAEEAPPVAAPSRRKPAGGTGILIVGVDKLLTAPAKCCRPAPPDPIVGFVTLGHGVTIHRRGCANVARLDKARLVPADWGEAGEGTFPVDIVVQAVDRTGLLRDIGDVLTRERINVTATNTSSRNMTAQMRFTVEVESIERLQKVLALIREVPGVLKAGRR